MRSGCVNEYSIVSFSPAALRYRLRLQSDLLAACTRARGRRADYRRRRDLIVAVQSRHLFDQIHIPRNIAATQRNDHVQRPSSALHT